MRKDLVSNMNGSTWLQKVGVKKTEVGKWEVENGLELEQISKESVKGISI